MADESIQSIVINAAPAQILAVIADFDAYPQWAKGITSAQVLDADAAGKARQVRFTIDHGPIKDEYVLEYEWADDQVSWTLVKGVMQKSQRGSYQLSANPGRSDSDSTQTESIQTTVTYTLSVQLVVPMIGLFRRKAEKVIMDTALKELKRRVEADQ